MVYCKVDLRKSFEGTLWVHNQRIFQGQWRGRVSPIPIPSFSQLQFSLQKSGQLYHDLLYNHAPIPPPYAQHALSVFFKLFYCKFFHDEKVALCLGSSGIPFFCMFWRYGLSHSFAILQALILFCKPSASLLTTVPSHTPPPLPQPRQVDHPLLLLYLSSCLQLLSSVLALLYCPLTLPHLSLGNHHRFG